MYNKTIEYYKAEMQKMFNLVHYLIKKNYFNLYNQEEERYKKSDEYKKAKSKAYWNRPLEEINREALNDILFKLDYWTARQNTTGKSSHITYSKNAVDNLTFETPVGFKPSVSHDEFFSKEIIKVKQVVSHPMWQTFFDEMLNPKINCDAILESTENIYINKCFRIEPQFLRDLIAINNHFSYVPSSSGLRKETANIVTIGCEVVVNIIGQSKQSKFEINIDKFPNQAVILGCKVSDVFSLPGIPLKYEIKEIWN